jgi:membrane fusion protein, heavy metal efflux system
MTKYIWIAIIIAFSALPGCSSNITRETATVTKTDTAEADVITFSEKQATNAGLALGSPEMKEMHTNLKVTGMIDVPPENIVSVSLPMGGYIKKTTLLPGLKVSRGMVLATVEDQQYIQLHQDYLTAGSKLAYYEAEYNRQQQLNTTHASSDKVFQQAKSDFEGQRILQASLAEKLRLIGIDPGKVTEKNLSRSISLYSPIDGYVTKVNVNPGKYASPTDILFELVNTSALHLTLTVFENDAAGISEGQKVSCYTSIHPEVKYNAFVHLVNPSISKERSTEVHCHIDKPGKELLPGMFMNAEIELDNAKMKCLPEDAIVKWENENYIFYQEGTNNYKMFKVKTGTSDEGYVPILSELPEAKIVTRGAYALLSKLKNSAEE